ncbi:transmembrane signal receptor [Lithospermum erythrorhizon]|uniref:Transmembrane signal receptor n=1 Tax=Lithospermum erythrorhizon TaxID=34254 RepID=A0AAV3QDS8_LITER
MIVTRNTRKKIQKERVYEFLTGLNQAYDEVKGRIISRTPFPITEEAFSKAKPQINPHHARLSEARDGEKSNWRSSNRSTGGGAKNGGDYVRVANGMPIMIRGKKKTIGFKWVITVKYNEKGEIERYKARLVANGFTQTYGIDFSEIFAPVAKLNTVRVLLSLATNLEWGLHQLDNKNVFLNGGLEEEVYMIQPPGFEQGNNRVCKLQKSLYGLKQSLRAWFHKFSKEVKNSGYIQSQADHTIFINHTGNGELTVLIA